MKYIAHVVVTSIEELGKLWPCSQVVRCSCWCNLVILLLLFLLIKRFGRPWFSEWANPKNYKSCCIFNGCCYQKALKKDIFLGRIELKLLIQTHLTFKHWPRIILKIETIYLFKVKDIISFVICTLHLYYSLCLSMFLLSGALLNSQKDERCRRLKNPPQAVWRKWDIFHPCRCNEDFAIKISLFKFCTHAKSTIITLNTTTVHLSVRSRSHQVHFIYFFIWAFCWICLMAVCNCILLRRDVRNNISRSKPPLISRLLSQQPFMRTVYSYHISVKLL